VDQVLAFSIVRAMPAISLGASFVVVEGRGPSARRSGVPPAAAVGRGEGKEKPCSCSRDGSGGASDGGRVGVRGPHSTSQPCAPPTSSLAPLLRTARFADIYAPLHTAVLRHLVVPTVPQAAPTQLMIILL